MDTEEDLVAYRERTLNISLEDLNTEFIRLPGDVAYWNARYADAMQAAENAEIEYKRAYGVTFLKYRSEGDGGKALPIEAVKAKCDANGALVELKQEVTAAERERLNARGMVDAVMAKRDMIQSLGAKLRAEMRGDPMLREQMRD